MRKTKRKRKLLIVVFVLLLAIVIGFIDSNSRIVTSEYEAYSARLPENFDGFRIVQLSDLHGKEFGDSNEKLLSAIAEAEPDIIAITGDFFDEHTEEGFAARVCAQLMEIAPVYYVSGNHEWVRNTRATFAQMEEVGVNVLRNEYVTLARDGQTIVLAGVDDPNGPSDMITKEDFVAKIKSETDDYILMLSHRNNELELWSSLDVDTVLCGHAHGGMIRLPIIGGLFMHKEDRATRHLDGSFTSGNTTMIVSRGLGNSGGSLRFYNNPEIVVTVLRCN